MDFPAGHFSFDAVDDEFDVERAGGARLIVMHCTATEDNDGFTADDCYSGRDQIIISLYDEARDWYSEFSLGAVDYGQSAWLSDGSVPGFSQFRNPTVHRAFILCDTDFNDCVDTYTYSYPDTSLSSVDISWVPALAMDFEPGDETNGVDPAAAATIRVAIETTRLSDGDDLDFDAMTVNPATLRLGRLEAPNLTWPVFSDVDGDSDMDAVFSFAVAETGITCDDNDVHLSGETHAGEAFFATDAITTLNCDSGCHP
jgi:hypothetical protein